MTKNEQTETENTTEIKPRRKRQTVGRIVNELYKVDEDTPENLEFLGSVPDIPQSAIRLHVKKNYGAGFYVIQTKQGGKFKGEYEMQLEDLPQSAEPDESLKSVPVTENNSEQEDFEFEDDSMPFTQNDAEVMRLRWELAEEKRRAREQRETLQTNQSETLSLIREMQKQSKESFNQGLQLAQMMMQNQTNQQPNPATLMIEMLQNTLAVQRGVKELSEEISPPTRTESGNILDGAANLIDSISRNAPKILPVVAGLSGLKPSGILPTTSAQTPMHPVNGNSGSSESSNLSEMFSKIKETEKDEK